MNRDETVATREKLLLAYTVRKCWGESENFNTIWASLTEFCSDKRGFSQWLAECYKGNRHVNGALIRWQKDVVWLDQALCAIESGPGRAALAIGLDDQRAAVLFYECVQRMGLTIVLKMDPFTPRRMLHRAQLDGIVVREIIDMLDPTETVMHRERKIRDILRIAETG